ncbi:MAG: hypothetical protein FJ252_08545, partial [Phycisphaerae bacterium]|nr:hypothetical protein [Phycisphaerae bacterium]
MTKTIASCVLLALIAACAEDDAPPPPVPMKPAASTAASVPDARIDDLTKALAKALDEKAALLKKAGSSGSLTGADAEAFWEADAGFVKGFVNLQALMQSNGRLTPRIVESLKKNAYSAMEAYAYAEKAAGVARASGAGIAGKPPAGHPRLDPTMMQSFELKRMEIMTKFSF